MCCRPFETRSLPSSLAATPRGFPFYVAFPKSSIRSVATGTSSFYACHAVASVKVGRSRLSGSVDSQLYLDRSHDPVLAPATLAALPSTRSIPDRDVFYVAQPIRSIDQPLDIRDCSVQCQFPFCSDWFI